MPQDRKDTEDTANQNNRLSNPISAPDARSRMELLEERLRIIREQEAASTSHLIVIAKRGEKDGTPDSVRTGHLRPIIDHIKQLGFEPFVDRFIFDKTGYGQYMFKLLSRRYLIQTGSKMEKPAIGESVARSLLDTFEFPNGILVDSSDGSVYDDNNALQIGFSELPNHPMLNSI